MSIMKTAQIKDPNSEEYLRLISRIYIEFDHLAQEMKEYALAESLFYVQLAQKCFKEAVEKDLQVYLR